MNISFVTTYNALNIHKWSGTPFFMAKSLENQGANMAYIGDLRFSYESIFKGKQLLYKLINKRYHRNREPSVAKSYASQVMQRLPSKTDVVFGPDSVPFAYLDTHKPKVFYTDATFANMVDYYEAYSNLCSETIEKGNDLEKKALENCDLAIYSSEWAAKSAIEFYGISCEKVKIVPLGANLICNRKIEDIYATIKNKPKGVCNLLMLGVDWERKGGDLVVKTARKLIEKGINAKVNVVGIPDVSKLNLPEFVISHGFISKSTADGQRRIDKLISESHFLMVPSKAEAFGVVFCEASSFGLPSLSTKTGGITTVIRDNINGCTFDLDANEDAYVNFIVEQMKTEGRYKELALSTFDDYLNRLSWEASGRAVFQHLQSLV